MLVEFYVSRLVKEKGKQNLVLQQKVKKYEKNKRRQYFVKSFLQIWRKANYFIIYRQFLTKTYKHTCVCILIYIQNITTHTYKYICIYFYT